MYNNENNNEVKSFAERKKELLEKLIENEELVKELLKRSKTEKEKVDTYNLLYDPKTEKELAIANVVFGFLYDTTDLVISINLDETKQYPIEENTAIQMLIKLYMAKSKKEMLEIIKNMNTKELAKFYFDILVIPTEECIEYLTAELNKKGEHIESILDYYLLSQRLDQINKAIQKNVPVQPIEGEISDENLEKYLDFYNEFHRLCQEAKIEKSIDEKRRDLEREKIILELSRTEEINRHL